MTQKIDKQLEKLMDKKIKEMFEKNIDSLVKSRLEGLSALDYLSDKEASKGECNHHPNFKKENGDCVMCVLDKPKNPPQQEEYKGEVGDLWNVGLPEDHPIFDKPKQEECKCIKMGNGVKYIPSCPIHYPYKPQPVKEESPKEDESQEEWEEDYANLCLTMGADMTLGDYKILKDYIKANFVSKVKIKRYCNELIESYDIASDYDSGVRNGLKKLKESLGLEELC